MPIHRRAILKGGLAAIAAAGLPDVALRAETTRPKKRVIPSSGEAIPVVGLGTWITFNVGTDPVLLDESVAVMAAFFEAGGTVIDSSPMYGSSQDTVGHGLAKLGYPPVFAADKIADMKIAVDASRALVLRVGWLMDHGFDTTSEAAVAKAFVSEAAVRTQLDAIQIHGGYGYMVESEVERGLRDAVAGTIYSGTSQIQRRIIARQLGL